MFEKMKKQKKVVVAMSGGVDSSVAAALLKEQGCDVIGVTMDLFSLPKKYCRSEQLRSCCGWRAAEDASRVAVILGIQHSVIDLRTEFEKEVIENFCTEYARGETPNPCIRCNQYIKFRALMTKAQAFQADYLATGHHARIVYDSQCRRFLLKKGKDRMKDQSYFLYTMTQDQLSQTLMPVGDFTKKEVREKAHKMGLPIAQRPESQEICFIPDNDYVGFLQNRIPEVFHPGPIIDLENRILGQHKGIAHFTIGQRRGMRIAAAHPLYVLSIRSQEDTIVVGPKEQLYEKTLVASKVNLVSIQEITKPLNIKAKIRYKHREANAVLSPLSSDQVFIKFEKSQRAVSPGQSVVFYNGDVVVGGGVINKKKT